MYDVIIIGGGVAGMTAAIYTLRASKKVLILEKENIGGQIISSPLVENYPGFSKISGSELVNNLYKQVLNLKGEVELEEVVKIENSNIKKVITEDNVYQCKSIIIATGAKNRLLGLSKEEEFIGNGICFCVTCDGAFYQNKVVAVIGGGNTAVINALALSDICKKVYVIQDLAVLTGEPILNDKLLSKENIEIIYNAKVLELKGEDELQAIMIEINDKKQEIKLDGMFISIGQIPQTEIVENLVNLNKLNYILADESCHTNLEGIFVAGDCRDKMIRQLTTATSDGTIAAIETIKYLNK